MVPPVEVSFFFGSRSAALLADKAEPSRYQKTAVAADGAGTDGTTNVRGRSIDCNERRMTVRKLPTDCGEFTEPTSARVSPVVAETAHTHGTGVMQYQWDDRKSVKTTEMRMPRNYLEIPEPRLPRVFLDLTEEARNVIVENGRSCFSEEVQPQGTGLTRPVFVTIMVDSPPVLKKRALRAEQPVLLGPIKDERGNESAGPVGPDVNSAGRGEPVDRSGPVDPQSTTEQPVLLGLDTDESGNAPAGPVGPDVISTGRGEPVDLPGLVGPHNRTEQSIFLGLDADQVGHVPASPVDPDVMMYSQ